MAWPRATWSSSTAWTGCVPAPRWKLLRNDPRSNRLRRARGNAAGHQGANESVAAVHPEAGRDHAADGRDPACRRVRVPPAADLGAAAGRLPDHPDLHLLPRREPRGDGFVGDRAPRAAIRPDSGAQADAVLELRRRLGDHAAVRPDHSAGRGRAGRAGGHQRRLEPAAAGPAGAAGLQQGESGGRADPHAGAFFEHADAAADPEPGRHAACAEALADRGRGPGHALRRTAPRGAGAGQPEGAGRKRPRPGRRAQRHRRRQREEGDVQIELLFAVALVVLVIFLFLRNLPATIIPSVAVPVSLIGTFGFMYLAGFSINNLTLMALVVAAGFVVDDAIVVIENIARHIEQGSPPLQAALNGSREIGFTIISLTFSLIAVLIPLLFMGDVVGRLFREFAVTLAVAILISGVVSLTLTPMMCARFLHKENDSQENSLYRITGRWFDAVIARYGRALEWVLDRQVATLLVAAAALGLTVVLYLVVPKGFFPVQDTGVIQGISEAQQSEPLTAMAERQQALAKVVLGDPAVESLSSFIGVDGTNVTLNSGRMLINLKPLSVRRIHASDIIRRLQPELAKIPSITLYMQPVQDLTIEDRISRTQYQYTLEAAAGALLDEWVPKMIERLNALPELTDNASDLQNQGLQAYVDIDRDSAGRLGITPAAIDTALYNAFGQRLISTIYTQATQYRVVLEVKPEFRGGPDALKDIYVAPASGPQVPLSSIAQFSTGTAPLAINHIGQFPAVTISFNLAPRYSLGHAVDAIQAVEREIGLPASVQTAFQGAAASFRDSLSSTLLLILAAVVTMYIVLGVLYESYIHPVTILSTLPTATVGAL